MFKRILAAGLILVILLVSVFGCSEARSRGFPAGQLLVVSPAKTSVNLLTLSASSQAVLESAETGDVPVIQAAVSAADLIIQAVTWSPVNPSKDDVVTFTVTIKNQGSDKSMTTRVYFYADGFYKSSQDVPSLDAGGQVTRTFTWIAEVGPHVIKVVVDAENFIAESDKSNNERTVTITSVLPDLVIEAITWSKTSPVAGDNVSFTVTIKNQGSGRADYSSLAFYIDDNLLSSPIVAPINANTTAKVTLSWIVYAGSHTIKAVADKYSQVAETVEDNNEKEVAFPAIIPDLIVQSIGRSPSSPVAGQTVTFTVVIRNQGNARADSSRVDFYVNGFLQNFQDIPELNISSSVTKTFSWTAEPGSHTITAIVDPFNKVTESNENNNERELAFSGAPSADIIIRDITWSPVDQPTGEKVTFTVFIRNQGKGIATDSYVALYVDDVYLAQVRLDGIASGATDNKTFAWTVEAGSHFIKAVADYTKLVAEGNEDNNEKTAIYPVSPDLIVQGITWSPLKPKGSDNMTFDVVVKNHGSGPAGSPPVAFYIDNAYLGFVSFAPLSANATDNKTFTWTAQPGSHAVKAVIDPYDEIIESNENNNEKTLTFLVSLSPAPISLPVPSTTPTQEPAAAPSARPPGSPGVNPVPIPPVNTGNQLGLLLFVIPIVLLVAVVVVFLRYQQR